MKLFTLIFFIVVLIHQYSFAEKDTSQSNEVPRWTAPLPVVLVSNNNEQEGGSLENGRRFEKVVFPELDTKPEVTSDLKAGADCTPKKSVETCGKCLSGDQCTVGFCCPFMKVCVKSPSTDCETSAQCMSACRDNMEQSKCICRDENFPVKWAKPTCQDGKRFSQAFEHGYSWPPNVETVFKYSSPNLIKGLRKTIQSPSIMDDYPLKLVADIKVQAFRDKTLRVKLVHAQFYFNGTGIGLDTAHRIIENNSPNGVGIGHNLETFFAFSPFLHMPFLVLTKNGVVKKVIVSKNEPTSVTEIKKTLAFDLGKNGRKSNLQLVMRKAIIIPLKTPRFPKKINLDIGLSLGGESDNSCKGRCGDDLDPNASCQCNDVCTRFNDCCADKKEVCGRDGKVTDNDLKDISEELLKLDDNNAGSMIQTNPQGKTIPGNREDRASEPFFTSIDDQVWSIPTIKAILPLVDNYYSNVRIMEDNTSEEQLEESYFLSKVMETRVMKKAYQFCLDKGLFSGTVEDYKKFLKTIWFGLYDRSGSGPGSSGFEHVFLGEIKKGKVSGFHDWIYFYHQEKTNAINYLGYIDKANFNEYGSGISEVFTWNGVMKKYGSMFVGTSPELVMALDTICFLARPNNKPRPCLMSLNNVPVYITTWTTDYNGGTYIGSAYPDWDKSSSEIAQLREEEERS